MSGATLGTMIGVAFGGVWAAAGAAGLPRGWRGSAAVLSVLVAAALIAALILVPRTAATGVFRGSVYWIAVGIESAAVLVAAVVLNRRKRQDLLLPVIGMIVGIHFLGLWQATDLVRFVWIAIAMTAICGAALFLPARDANGTRARQIVAGFGTALVLWTAGAMTLFS